VEQSIESTRTAEVCESSRASSIAGISQPSLVYPKHVALYVAIPARPLDAAQFTSTSPPMRFPRIMDLMEDPLPRWVIWLIICIILLVIAVSVGLVLAGIPPYIGD
jgi:hypothetical protein